MDAGMSRRTAATHGDAGTAKLLADRAPMNAQLGTDLAQGPTLGVQVGCTLNVHGATVTSLGRIGPPTNRPGLQEFPPVDVAGRKEEPLQQFLTRKGQHA